MLQVAHSRAVLCVVCMEENEKEANIRRPRTTNRGQEDLLPWLAHATNFQIEQLIIKTSYLNGILIITVLFSSVWNWHNNRVDS